MPAAWRNLDADSLVQAVSNHTAQVLQRFKDDGVRPRWVQVGGPAAGGFLLPFGRIEANPEGFARCFEAGARAVKSVFPRTAVVVHFGPGTERTAMDRTLEVLRENCVRWDIVSWSSFPAPDEDRETADGRVSALLEELRRIPSAGSTEALIGEIGFSCKAGEYELNRRRLAYLLGNAGKLRRCRGLFYYEPEVRPKDSTQPLGAFDDFGHPTPIMEGFR